MIKIITVAPDEIEIKQSAIEEYLGYFGAKADAVTLSLIEECRKEIHECIDFRACISEVGCCENENGGICLDFMQSSSKSLAGNLYN